MAPYRALCTERLEIHYADTGPRDGEPVLLLHGWPDGAQTWEGVARALNAAGLRTIVPFLRGFGPTRHLDADTPRSGQITALAQDAVDLLDGLGIGGFSVVGHDWGARTAYVLAQQEADRARRCVALSVGYASIELSLSQAQQFWYQWFLTTRQGEHALRSDASAFCRHLWRDWSVTWAGVDQAYDGVVANFDNPDWFDTTLHAYRHRWGLAPSDPYYAQRERSTQGFPAISVPTLLIHGGADRCIIAQSSTGLERYFLADYRRVELPGVGHFP